MALIEALLLGILFMQSAMMVASGFAWLLAAHIWQSRCLTWGDVCSSILCKLGTKLLCLALWMDPPILPHRVAETEPDSDSELHYVSYSDPDDAHGIYAAPLPAPTPAQ